jgi:biotin carboxylase
MPRYTEITTVEEALQAAVEWGYPSILKPKSSQSCFGVFKVDNERRLHQCFADTLKESRDGKILIEKFVEGTEVTVEGRSLAGKYRVPAISEKEHYCFNPCVAKRPVYPLRLDPNIMARIRDSPERVFGGTGVPPLKSALRGARYPF